MLNNVSAGSKFGGFLLLLLYKTDLDIKNMKTKEFDVLESEPVIRIMAHFGCKRLRVPGLAAPALKAKRYSKTTLVTANRAQSDCIKVGKAPPQEDNTVRIAAVSTGVLRGGVLLLCDAYAPNVVHDICSVSGKTKQKRNKPK